MFNVAEGELFNVPRGRGQSIPARSVAIYLARKTVGKSLVFGLAHYGHVLGIIGRFTKQLQQDNVLAKLVNKAEKIIKE